ncbi:recombination-associated protein RdgC [Paraburkholderia sediminicola]|uniref:recombination-associated protein RdgC n=1 Tax=Paraburkholderia sediminicola TaxID=458836 RepID=UPI0038BCA19D
MWFKNLTLYRIPGFPFSADDLAAALARTPFEPCQSYNDRSSGWTPARHDQYVYTADGEHMIVLRTSRKVLPSSVVKRTVEERCAQWEKERGHKPGKKMRKEIKEQAYDDLLPKAFEVERDIRAWISPRHGILTIDTSSKAAADAIIGSLIRAVETAFTIHPARFTTSPASAMTQWIADEPPTGFTVDADSTTLVSSAGGSASIKYSGFALEADDARRQIEDGRVVGSLALTFEDKVSFILSGNGTLRRIAPVGVVKTAKKESKDDDVFASDFLLMAGTFGDLIAALSESLDGFEAAEDLFSQAQAEDEESDDEQAAAATGDDDPLVSEAQRVVLAQSRASISLVQRHLRIGYIHAARLLETLETRGVVSAMNNQGNRIITQAYIGSTGK